MKNKNILITGGAGFLGTELTMRLLLYDVDNITVFSRNEFSHVMMKSKFVDPRIFYAIGDIRDYEALLHATKDVDCVFHLAALKHVGICEDQPDEAVKTNVEGTINVIRACIENGVKKVVLISTDKAVNPASLYGMTKGICERLFIQANTFSDKTDFAIVRTGNILGSSGSVVPLFVAKAKRGSPVTVTDRSMTRFFLPAREIADLMIYAALYGERGSIHIPYMDAFYIGDLAKIIANYYGVEIQDIPAKPGESRDEFIISSHEARKTHIIDDHYVIHDGEFDGEKIKFVCLSSLDCIQGEDDLYKMLNENGMLR